MADAGLLDRGRVAFSRARWADAYTELTAADRDGPIPPADLACLATATVLVGHDVEGCEVLGRAHHAYLAAGDVEEAARCAFWAGMLLMNRGHHEQGGGWLAKARRAAEDGPADGVVHGYLQLPAALQAMLAGDHATALEGYTAALQVAERQHDPDLLALARLGVGSTRVRLGEAAAGNALLDEVMAGVTAGEISGIPAGIVYCSVIDLCRECYDLRRAREWTTGLTRWCEQQPDLVPFRGECLVNRAFVMMTHGDWADALAEVDRAVERLSDPPGQPELGWGVYQRAEILRLLGEEDAAEEAYRRANQLGRDPQPGLALLRVRQGRTAEATTGVRRALDAGADRASRGGVLPAVVEVCLAAGDVTAARLAVDELTDVAARLDSPWLSGVAAQGVGAVQLAEGSAADALATLRRAWTTFRELAVPYEAARTRTLMGRAYRALGDEEAAQLELDAARWAFTELGASQDLAAVESLSRGPGGAGRLTPREVEVIRLVATGRTNRAIAADLFLSEKTVARHLSNIFTKLDLPSRAAATAYAYEHRLV
jgi:DNA-binding CsgD family transcriptional regulator